METLPETPAPDAVRATWTPTHADVMTIWKIVYARHSERLAPSHYQFWTLAFLAAASLAGGFVAVALRVVDISNGATVALLCAATYYLTRFVEEKLFTRAVWRADLEDARRHMGSPRSLEVDATGIRVQGAGTRYMYLWSMVVDVSESRGMLLFWFGWRNPLAVPRRAFADDDLERVRALAREARSRAA